MASPAPDQHIAPEIGLNAADRSRSDESGATTPRPPQVVFGDEPHHHRIFHHHHSTGRRVKQFFRPDGRRVHIASTPEEHQRLQRHLSVSEPDPHFDLYVYGTPEHLDAIRELHTHHEARRQSLIEKHQDVYEEVKGVLDEIDALGVELRMLTEHGVALDANFSKFGYSAHLRTKGDDSHDGGSTRSSLSLDRSSGTPAHDWEAERRTGMVLRFFQRPVIRQYWHKGLIWRSPSSGEASSSELFVDLCFVGIIGVLGDTAAAHPNGESFVQFIVRFLMAWRVWTDITMVSNWFEIDDIVQKLLLVFYLVTLFGFTTNIEYAFESTYTAMTSFYLAERLFLSLWFVACAFLLPNIRGACTIYASITVLTSALWIGSIQLEYPKQLALVFLAIPGDIFGQISIYWAMRVNKVSGDAKTPFQRFIRKQVSPWFEFYPALNIEHRTSRNAAFVTLVFGSAVLSILFQFSSSEPSPLNAFFGKAVLGLLIAYAFNWLYFDIDSAESRIHVHAIRRHSVSTMFWNSLHIPFIMGFILAAAALADIVLAHDVGGAESWKTLGEEFVARSEEHLEQGLRWYFCGGIGVALASMGAISFTHVHKKVEGARLQKRPRLVIRAIVSIIIICLPLAKDRLSSLDLVGTTAGLIIFQVLVEIYGLTCPGDRFWTSGWCAESKRNCRYSARCPLDKRRRKQLEKKIKAGEEVSIDDILRMRNRRDGSRSSLDSGETLMDEKEQGGGRIPLEGDGGWHA